MKPSRRDNEAQRQAELRAVARELHRRFDSSVTAAVVDLELQRALDKFAGARIRTYVPILAGREVMDRLSRRTSGQVAAGATADHPPAAEGPGREAKVPTTSSTR